jgi:pimeloyl-ACP methyl ester carboxylesterase
MAARNRRANYVEIEDAGHLVPLEQPAAFTRAIFDWLRILETTPKQEINA